MSGYGTGRHVMPSGYIRVWAPGHPLSNRDGYVLEHRKVMHDAGHRLQAGQHVHHINGDKQDNRLENLCVKTASQHVRDHAEERGFVENQFGFIVASFFLAGVHHEIRYRLRQRRRGGMLL